MNVSRIFQGFLQFDPELALLALLFFASRLMPFFPLKTVFLYRVKKYFGNEI